MAECGQFITSEEYLDLIASTDFFDVEQLKSGCYIYVNDRIINNYVPRNGLPALSLDYYSYESLPKCFTIMETVENVGESAIAEISNRQELTGKGVILGFIDTGIDYRNSAFRNSDGTTRITHLWDQSIQGDAPEGYYYGAEYSDSQINEALRSVNPLEIVPSVDENGHGTYIASVAAGSEDISGKFKGIAPQTDIVVVKLKEAKSYLKEFFLIKDKEDVPVFQENDIMLGLKYMSEIAKSEEKVLVVCIALGSSLGGYGATTFLSSYIDSLALGRNFFVIGTGNEANKRHHFSGTVSEDESYEMEIRTSGNQVGFWLEIWGDTPDIFSIGITSPGGDRIEKIVYQLGETVEYDLIFEKTKITVDYLLYGERELSPLVVLRMINPSDGVWKIQLNGERIIYGNVNAFLPLDEFLAGETYFLESNPDSTLTAPSGARGAITLGAYDARNNSIYFSSGRGYTEQGYIKPDIVAMGVRVLGASNKSDGSLVAYSGTGVSAAVAAGAIALFLQWAVVEGNYPVIGNVIVKNFLHQSATRNDGRTYPNREWGYGALNLDEMFALFRYS